MSNTRGLNLKAQDGVFRFILKAKSAIQKVTQIVLFKIGDKLVEYSPVGNPMLWKRHYWPPGYNPGHFRNNWQLGVDEAPAGVISGEDPSGEASMARMHSAVPRWPVGHNYYFTNNLPYARRLETGTHSVQVPPQGMVGRVSMEFPQIVREAELQYIREEK